MAQFIDSEATEVTEATQYTLVVKATTTFDAPTLVKMLTQKRKIEKTKDKISKLMTQMG